MDICVLSIGKISSQWIKQGLDLFETRLKKYVSFNPLILPDVKNAKSLSIDSIKDEESKMIASQLNSSDYVVLMDEQGKEFTSRQFSEWIQKQMNSGKKRLVLIIGGPYGFSQNIYERADSKIALSKMTFTHEMAKLLLTEQIYRAFSILRGEPYHHD